MKPSLADHERNEDGGLSRDFLRKIRQIEIRARRVVDTVFVGEYHSAFKGRGMEYAESRQYQPGDDVRSMDWNVTARAGEPFVKTFQEERELTLILMVDMSASGRFGSREKLKSETATELCAAMALSAIKNNDKVGLIAFTDQVELYIAPKKGRKHVLRLIRELLCFKPRERGTRIGAALDYLNRVAKKKSIAFLVSDFKDFGYEKQLKTSARKHDLIAARIVDRREERLPNVGYIALRDAEVDETVVIDTSSETAREEYRERVEKDVRARDRLFAAAGVDQVVIDTGASYVNPLTNFFKTRERRARLG